MHKQHGKASGAAGLGPNFKVMETLGMDDLLEDPPFEYEVDGFVLIFLAFGNSSPPSDFRLWGTRCFASLSPSVLGDRWCLGALGGFAASSALSIRSWLTSIRTL